MENLMIKAIKQFKKEHKTQNAEIRVCDLCESFGPFGRRTRALFHIEYVEDMGDYSNFKQVDIEVGRKN